MRTGECYKLSYNAKEHSNLREIDLHFYQMHVARLSSIITIMGRLP